MDDSVAQDTVLEVDGEDQKNVPNISKLFNLLKQECKTPSEALRELDRFYKRREPLSSILFRSANAITKEGVGNPVSSEVYIELVLFEFLINSANAGYSADEIKGWGDIIFNDELCTIKTEDGVNILF